MRRLTAALLACVLLAATAGVASAAKPATRGFLPAECENPWLFARRDRHSL